jgi:hypothetical protein
MPQTLLNQILDQLKTLEPFELQQLSQAIQTYLSDSETAANQTAFHQSLIESGLVRQIKTPTFEHRAQQQPIRVQGEPVSQTIIEERR